MVGENWNSIPLAVFPHSTKFFFKESTLSWKLPCSTCLCVVGSQHCSDHWPPECLLFTEFDAQYVELTLPKSHMYGGELQWCRSLVAAYFFTYNSIVTNRERMMIGLLAMTCRMCSNWNCCKALYSYYSMINHMAWDSELCIVYYTLRFNLVVWCMVYCVCIPVFLWEYENYLHWPLAASPSTCM